MRTQKQQRGIAEDVLYEWEMVCWTFQTICRTIPGAVVMHEPGEPLLKVCCCLGTSRYEREASALLEPFLLHVRNIREFLYNDGAKKKDDVLALDFFDNPDDWTKKRPPIGAYLKSIRERLNKSLAHITYARLDYRQYELWDLAKIRHDLEKPWGAFMAALPPEKREWFSA